MHFLSEYEDFRVDSVTNSNPGLETSYHTVYRKLKCRLGGGSCWFFSVPTSSRVGDFTMRLTDTC